jgi:hypothetical protein
VNLDLKNFKRIGSDKETTTLQHPKGHQIVVKHSALPARMKKQLESLPMHAAPASSPSATQDSMKGAKIVKPAKAMADGGPAPTPSPKPDDTSTYQVGEPGSVGQQVTQWAQNLVGSHANGGCIPSDTSSTGGADKYGAACKPSEDDYAKAGGLKANKPDLSKQGGDPSYGGNSVQGLAKGGPAGPMNPKLAESKKCPHCGHGDSMEEPDQAPAYDDGGAAYVPPEPVDTSSSPTAEQSADTSQTSLPGGGNAYAQAAGINPNSTTAPYEVPNDPVGAAYANTYNKQAAEPLKPRTANVPVPEGTPPAPKAAPDTTPPVSTANPMAAGSNTAIRGLQAEQGANTALAGIANTQAKANQDFLDHNAAMQQENQATLTNAYQHFNDVHQATIDAINKGQIKPNDYINKMSTGGKISTGIGLILGGMGQGLMRSGTNPALDFLNRQIDRNIESQKANLGSQENLLSANMKQYQNQTLAVEATRMQETAIVQAQMNAKANEFGGQTAAQNAIAANGALNGKIGEMQNHMAMYSMLAGAQNSGDPVRAIQGLRAAGAMGLPGGEEMAKNMESKMMPGMGPNGENVLATQVVPQEAREKLLTMQDASNNIRRLQDFVKENGWSPNAWGAKKQQGLILAQSVQQSVRKPEFGGIYRQSEAPAMRKMISDDPTSFMGHLTAEPKLQELFAENEMQLAQAKKTYGIPTVAPVKSIKGFEAPPKVGK